MFRVNDMATKSENAEIAVLQDQMVTMKADVNEVKTDVKAIRAALENRFVRKEDFKAFKWITIPLVILLSATITALVGFYVTHQNTPAAATDTSAKTSSSTTPASTTGNPSATASSSAKADTTKPSDAQTSTMLDGVVTQVPKVTP